MKFTDKFVLVPVERYNQLTKGRGIKEGGEEKEIETLPLKEGEKIIPKIGVQSDIVKPSVDKKEVGEEPTEIVDEIDGGSNKKRETQIAQRKKRNPSKKERGVNIVGKQNSHHQLIPAPPPGIPNRLKKNKLRWLSIY